MSHLIAVDVEEMHELGRRLGGLLEAGDVIVLNGDLGAGKTTLTQGIARGLGVAEPVTSPTFVIVRRHRSGEGRPVLLHMDAYRIKSFAEVDDIDLDSELSECVLVAEWGMRKIDPLLTDYLLVNIDAADDEVRTLELLPFGERSADLAAQWEASA